MKKILLLFCLFAVINAVQAQDNRIANTDTPVEDVERLVMPPLDNKALIKAEAEARAPGRAPRFAENMEVFVTPDSHGQWEYLDNGNAVWRLRIYSKGAKSLNLGFTKYVMPAHGSLVLYSMDQERILGPFTPADNEVHEQLWTPVLDGDELVIEVQLPQTSVDDLQLELKSVNHDFIGFGHPSSMVSGSCNLDVICGEEDGWGIVDDYRDIIQSVAVIGTGGGTFCTGFLVNNVRQDCAPLFMTANHCGINAGNAPSLVAYWNFENSTCRQPDSGASGGNGDGQLNDFNTGATHLASYAPSDVTIVEFDDPISETANAFFAGWDATDAIPQSAIAVHHPSTDEKRISFENDPTYEGIGLSSQASNNGDHIVIPDWDIGTTEPGSSGSPVFNADKRVFGQLHGGGAACGNDAYDTYGWFYTSWEGGGTPSTRIKDYLDPDNTGTLVIDGRGQMQCSFFVDAAPAIQSICAPADLVYSINVSESFLADVTLTLNNLPDGVTATFGANPVAPGGTTELTISNTGVLAAGQYTISLSGTDGTEMNQSNLTINVATAAPVDVALNEPTDAAMEVSPAPAFTWTVENADSHEMQLATDDAYANIIANPTDLSEATFTASGLETLTTYYWRVRSTNDCGQSDWSATYSFTTGNCSIGASADVPVSIQPQGTPTITSTLTIPYSGTINDLDVVGLVGTHTYLGDLVISLTSPEGTTVVLVDEQCGSDENFDINFDDTGNTGLPCPYNDGGTYAPVGSLSDFNDENPQGEWILTIEDNANFDGGSLAGWGLQICASGVVNVSASVSPGNLEVCSSETGSFEVTVVGDFEGDVTVSAESTPAGLPIEFANPTTQAGGTVTASLGNLIAVPAGTYTISFTATDGNASASVFSSVEVETPPSIADLTAPADGIVNVLLSPSLIWEDIDNAVDYYVEVSTNEDMIEVVYAQTVTNNSLTVDVTLENETLYYWRVTANNECGSSLSLTNSFTTEELSGLNDLEGVTVNIQPNPTNGLVNVSFGQALEQNVVMEVFALNGQLLQSNAVRNGANNAQLDLGDYADGVYLIKLKSASDVLVRRIAVQK